MNRLCLSILGLFGVRPKITCLLDIRRSRTSCLPDAGDRDSSVQNDQHSKRRMAASFTVCNSEVQIGNGNCAIRSHHEVY